MGVQRNGANEGTNCGKWADFGSEREGRSRKNSISPASECGLLCQHISKGRENEDGGTAIVARYLRTRLLRRGRRGGRHPFNSASAAVALVAGRGWQWPYYHHAHASISRVG